MSSDSSESIGKESKEPENSLQEDLAAYKLRARVYKKIINRYADAIGRGEQKTVPQLKELIKPGDLAVLEVRDQLINKVEGDKKTSVQGKPFETKLLKYDFEKDFLAVAPKAFEYVKSLQSINAEIDASYWLSPAEIVELQAADPMDKAIFLCSLLHALGCKDARVRLVQLEDASKHPLVIFQYDNQTYLLDALCESWDFHASKGELDALLQGFSCQGKKYAHSLYEFSNEEYSEL
ncbi:MAG: hypothetical protein ACE5DI_03365 [Candidatus Micrarchaeia archaeon]